MTTTSPVPFWLAFSLGKAMFLGIDPNGKARGFAAFVPGFNEDSPEVKEAARLDLADLAARGEDRTAPYPHRVADIAVRLLSEAGATEESARACRDYLRRTSKAEDKGARRATAVARLFGRDERRAVADYRAKAATQARRAAGPIVLTRGELDALLDAAVERGRREGRG
jgi:hypothetical protein